MAVLPVSWMAGQQEELGTQRLNTPQLLVSSAFEITVAAAQLSGKGQEEAQGLGSQAGRGFPLPACTTQEPCHSS